MHIVIFLSLFITASAFADDGCVEIHPCFFRTSQGGFIDLTPLKDRVLMATAYLALESFQFSPCQPFQCKNPNDALVCRLFPWSKTVLIGGNHTATCNKPGNDVVLLYEDNGLTVHVTLKCTKGGTSTLRHETVLRFHDYSFILSSPHACEKGITTFPTTNTPTTSPTNTTEHTTSPTNTTKHTTSPTNTTEHTTSPTNTTEHTTSPTNTTEHTTSPTNTTEHTTSPTNTTEHTTSPTNTTEHTTSPTNTTEHTTSPTNTTEHTTSPTATTEKTSTSTRSTAHTTTHTDSTTHRTTPTRTSPGSTAETTTTGHGTSMTSLLSYVSLTAMACLVNRIITF